MNRRVRRRALSDNTRNCDIVEYDDVFMRACVGVHVWVRECGVYARARENVRT